MNTKQLSYVLTLAREGSFSKAAETLGITQPSLSQYIKKIEQETGLELFDRRSAELRITEAGQAYVETGRRILDLEHQLDNRLADLAAYRTGTILVGAAPYRAVSLLPAVTAAFQKRYPGMHLVVREGTTAELTEGMLQGEFDLALTLLPVDGSQLSIQPVAEEELVLAVPASRPAFQTETVADRRYPAVDAAVLNGQRMVMLTDRQFMQRQLEDLIQKYRIAPETAAVVKSLEAQIAMVRAGVGIALVPTGIERFCAPGEVRFYSFQQSLPKRQVAVIWRKDRPLSAPAAELSELLRAASA